MTEPSTPLRAPLWSRLAVTVGLLVGYTALPRLPMTLPGVDTSGMEVKYLRSFSVFALGIMPLVSAMAIVELVALGVPSLRPLRHGGPEGRGKLARATLVLAAALSLFQGFGIARLLESLEGRIATDAFSPQLVVLSLAAGTFLLVLLAELASVHGLASGLAVLLVGGGVTATVDMAVTLAARDKLPAGWLAGTLAGAAATVAVTWFLLRAPRVPPATAPGASGYRTRGDRGEPPSIAIPAPASGIALLIFAGSALGLVEWLKKLDVPVGRVEHLIYKSDRGHLAASMILIVALGVAFTWLFNAPSRVAGVMVRARAANADGDEDAGDGEGEGAAIEAEARAGMRVAALRSVVFLAALFAIWRVTRDSSYSPSSFGLLVGFALGTALAMDIAAEWRARRALPDLVPVWPEHRPYAIAPAREALARAGIAVHARGENLRRLLQLAGPFVPIDLMVPRADAERAAAILGPILRYHREDEPGSRTPAPAKPRPWTRLETRLVVAAAMLGGGSLLLPVPAPPPPRSHAPARPEALQLLEVDDDDDLFSRLRADLPAGVSIFTESAPLGPGRTAERRFARIVAGEGEGLEQARARLLAWARTLAAPQGLEVRVQSVSEYDEERDRTERIGWRTYVVKGAPIIDGSDVKDAMLQPTSGSPEGWGVRVELRPAGAERFRAFTAAHAKRRLAIVVDGVVESVPVILGEIGGGVVMVTMGAGPPEQQLADAKRLEERLLGQPGP